ncbi:hypothetical protein A3Q56_04923 [Intoshia linei]|uniref:Uncharacterized protein n=1 Tax=Intoshia linei TaxID=1819745 RepID=A0A177B126_9BILA|nr:hypothetical protein A3Q56_04923 [Intoshia linei]
MEQFKICFMLLVIPTVLSLQQEYCLGDIFDLNCRNMQNVHLSENHIDADPFDDHVIVGSKLHGLIKSQSSNSLRQLNSNHPHHHINFTWPTNSSIYNIIIINDAKYGIMDANSKCVRSPRSIPLCSTNDVKEYLNSKCAGHEKCSIKMTTIDEIFKPCQPYIRSYLQFNYDCISAKIIEYTGFISQNTTNEEYVLKTKLHFIIIKKRDTSSNSQIFNRNPTNIDESNPTNQNKTLLKMPNLLEEDTLLKKFVMHDMKMSEKFMNATKSEILKNVNINATQIYTVQRKIRIIVNNRQKLLVTLRNLNLWRWLQTIHKCNIYISIKGGERESLVDLCSQLTSTLFYYETDENWIEITFFNEFYDPVVQQFTSNHNTFQETLKYLLTVEVHGCSDYIPTNRVMKTIRHGEVTRVICPSNNESWFVTCSHNNRWIGQIGLCSNLPKSNVTFFDNIHSILGVNRGYTSSIMTAIIIGVIFGISLGIMYLCCIYTCYKRKSYNIKTSQYQNTINSIDPNTSYNLVDRPKHHQSRIYKTLNPAYTQNDPYKYTDTSINSKNTKSTFYANTDGHTKSKKKHDPDKDIATIKDKKTRYIRF